MQLHFNKIGNGPALIILHGLYGSGDNWYHIAKALSEKFTVYLVDQRNHGLSPHTASHSYEEMTDDLKLLIDSEKLVDICLIGHSMGGKTAMSYTLQFGAKVKTLINVDIAPYSYHGLEHFNQQFRYHQSIIERFLTAPIRSTNNRNEIEEHFAKKITNVETRRFLLKNLKREKEGSFSWKLNVHTISNSLDNVIDAAPPIKLGAQGFTNTLFIRGGKFTLYLG
jgi:esterase